MNKSKKDLKDTEKLQKKAAKQQAAEEATAIKAAEEVVIKDVALKFKRDKASSQNTGVIPVWKIHWDSLHPHSSSPGVRNSHFASDCSLMS